MDACIRIRCIALSLVSATYRNTSSPAVIMSICISVAGCLSSSPFVVVVVTVALPVTSLLHEAARFLEGTIMRKQYGCRFKAGTSKPYYT